MKRFMITLALSLLVASSVALGQEADQPLPKEARERLDYAIGSWTSRTESIGLDGEVRGISFSDSERKFIDGDRVVEISVVDRASGDVCRAWEFYDPKEGKYCHTSITGGGQLTAMRGDLGDLFRWTSDDQEDSDGSTMAMRFTHSDFKPNSFAALGEYSLDSGKTWRVFSRQFLTRQTSAEDADKEGKPGEPVQSAAAPAEDHEYYGTLTFEDGQQLTGGPSLETGLMIYMDALGTQEVVKLQLTGEATMASGGSGPQVGWSRDDHGTLVAAEFLYGDGRERTARFKGTRSEPIEIENEGDRIRGRLHLPTGDGPHPAIVLIHGSGDCSARWGTFVSFFVDLGIAVVAYDKRGVGVSEGDWREGSYEVLAEDAARFVDALGDRPDIDRKRIGLMGHSEGGYVAPITAAKRKQVAFVLVRVGPAVPFPDVVQYQNRDIASMRGRSEKELAAWDQLYQLVTDGIRNSESYEAMQKNLEPLRTQGWLPGWSPSGDLLDQFLAEWDFYVRNANHSPAEYLSTLRAPVLWFLGETDMNVETATTVAVLDKSLVKHPDATVVVLPNIDHKFVVRSEEGSVRYAPGFFDRMKEWLSIRGLTGAAAVR